jgi:hypothetical protein
MSFTVSFKEGMYECEQMLAWKCFYRLRLEYFWWNTCLYAGEYVEVKQKFEENFPHTHVHHNAEKPLIAKFRETGSLPEAHRSGRPPVVTRQFTAYFGTHIVKPEASSQTTPGEWDTTPCRLPPSCTFVIRAATYCCKPKLVRSATSIRLVARSPIVPHALTE